MHTLSWLFRIGIAVVIILGGRMIATAATRRAENNKTDVTKEEYVYRADERVFTGTVVTNDLQGKTITIEGHNPLRRETVERVVARDKAGQEKAGEKKTALKEVSRTFQVDPACCVSLSNNLTGQISDIKTDDEVDVEYRKVLVTTNTTLMASAIRPAVSHPYDSPAARAKPKK